MKVLNSTPQMTTLFKMETKRTQLREMKFNASNSKVYSELIIILLTYLRQENLTIC